MAALDFPNSPTIGQMYQGYTWDGEKWALGAAVVGFPTPELNLGLSVTAAANALTINLLTASGATPSPSSPVYVSFRDPLASVGTLTTLSITSALSLVISSGSTLGVASAVPFRLWIVMFNDGGTPRLGVINCAGAYNATPIHEDRVNSSIAEGGAGAADSAGIFYTGVAATNKSLRILGYAEWSPSGITAGSWTITNLGYVQVMGPGIKKPGDVVAVYGFAGSSILNASTALTDITNAFVSPILKSAANKVACFVGGSAFATAGGAGVNSEVSIALVRNGVTLITCTTGVVSGSGTNMQSDGAVGLAWIDTPNTTIVTYKAQQKCLNTSHNVSSSVFGMFQEIMV